VAVEPSRQRLELLGGNFARLGLTAVDVFSGTLQDFAQKTTEIFRAVLVDAPCSGLGVTGRHPDIRWLRKPEDLKRYPEKQLALLNTAAALVGPGGVLVYATCSTEPEENDQVVAQFLGNNVNFQLADARGFLPAAAHCLVDDRGFLRTVPGTQVSDGFFAARLVKS
jgi:16S rRNA (cytosine967-C5)-methyltransferase